MDALPLLFATVRLIGWALVHFLWQATLLGLLYGLTRMVLPRGEARYRFGMGILVALAVCPLLTLGRLLRAAPLAFQTANGALTPFTTGADGLQDGLSNATSMQGAGIDALLPWLVLAWLSGVLLLSLRAWRQWRALKTLVRLAEVMPAWQDRVAGMARRFGLRRNVMVLCSNAIATPALVGWLRPVILLPIAVACGFPAAQIELIFAHELAHLRRWDPLANLFQVVLETLHFYHPVVHWISRDVRNEREICCDRLALSVTGGNRQEFVAALAELGELRERHGALLLAANGGVLLDRVRQIVVPEKASPRMGAPARFAAILLGAALVALTLQLEWRQEQLQRGIDASIMQLQTMLTPAWLPLAESFKMVPLPDLVPARIEALRPGISASADQRVPAVRMRDGSAAAVVPQLLPVRISDPVALLRPHDIAPARIDVLDPALAALAVPLTAPTPLRMLQPVYPQSALMRNIEGRVVLEFHIGANGSVQDMRVVSAEPSGVFDQAAIQAMRGWRFAVPADSTGQRRYRQTMAFMLNTDTTGARVRAGEQIRTDESCRIVTGTHICRWPDINGPNTTAAIGNGTSS